MTEQRGQVPVAPGMCPVCRQQFPITTGLCPRHHVRLTAVERSTEPANHASRTLVESGFSIDDPSDHVTDLERRGLTPKAGSSAGRGTESTVLERAYQPKAAVDVTPKGEPAVRVREAATLPEGVPPVEVGLAQGPTTSVVGQVFDGYITTSVLAEGGMGVVYEAQHPLLGTQAVVKVLKKLLKGDPVSRRRMVTEGQTLSALVHRNVVRVFGFGHLSDGRPWLLMERLVGESLYSMLKGNGALGIDEALPLMNQMAAGLEATHSLGVVHRDLKPDNIYVTVESDGERQVKLIDFGIARPDVASTVEQPGQDHRTMAGHFVGTILYGAPELFLGASCSKASDVYALGAVFFEMLTGRRVFAPPAPQDVVKMHLDDEPPRVRDLVKSVPPAVDDLVFSMLAKPPEARPSIEDVRAVLRPERLSVAALAPVRSTPPWVWLMLVALVGVSAAFAWMLLRG
ncbi:MAG: serine/threonine-protein kinase [Myxococcales bacterium]|nr:serine/threonine-protein kinase [Myxococcales bacterium]